MSYWNAFDRCEPLLLQWHIVRKLGWLPCQPRWSTETSLEFTPSVHFLPDARARRPTRHRIRQWSAHLQSRCHMVSLARPDTCTFDPMRLESHPFSYVSVSMYLTDRQRPAFMCVQYFWNDSNNPSCFSQVGWTRIHGQTHNARDGLPRNKRPPLKTPLQYSYNTHQNPI
jgi:hypothetical protein